MNKILYTLVVCLFLTVTAFSQEESSQEVATEAVTNTLEEAWTVTDEMTVDAEQNKNWRMGQYNYSAKPKNAWELGIHLGHMFIDGDVDTRIPGGYGIGLHLRKAITYSYSLRLDFMYGSARGLDPQPWKHRNDRALGQEIGGGLVEPVFSAYDPNTGGPSKWFPAYKTRYMYLAVQNVFNIGNMLFHNKDSKWNINAAIGAGFDSHKTKLDLLGGNGQPYTDLISRTGFNFDLFDTKSGRKDIKNELDNIYDGEYETEGFRKAGIFRLGDDTNIHVVWTASLGVARRISKRFNIGIEHQIMLSDNDYLDGIKFRTSDDQTNNVDIPHYTNVRLNFNLGNFSKKAEPLYWLNPLDAAFGDIAELKQRPVLDLTDEDGDGIIDMMDQELETPAGCPVDTRGVTLDSDGDGIADCKDKEPFSPPGYDVDDVGIAKVPVETILNETDIIKIMNENCPGCKYVPQPAKTGCGEWFLPMIHFDLDKYKVKPEFYSQLHHVASVMKQCPELCIVAEGHTDARNSNQYNQVLSYNRAKAAVDYLVSNYGVDRSRIKLMYGGEENPMVNIGSEGARNYMNRRVEFRVCDGDDYDMAAPEGSAGSANYEQGSTYKGNKNSGY